MRVFVQSAWSCDPDRVWDLVQRSATLQTIAWPLVTFEPVGAPEFPERWRQGLTVECRSRLFGALPLGVRRLTFERIDDARREIQTRESDPLVRRWDHLIRVEATADGRTRYSDTIEIDAGLATRLVWLFGQAFYRHRQRRWRTVLAQQRDVRAYPRTAEKEATG